MAENEAELCKELTLSQRPDIATESQSSHPRGLDQVGMAAIECVARLEQPELGTLSLPAKARATVNLIKPEARGIHMSRLYLGLQSELQTNPLSVESLAKVVQGFLSSHSDLSDRARLELSFDLPLTRPALKSAGEGLRHYPVKLLVTGTTDRPVCLQLSTTITYASTCPCSASLARQLIQEKFLKDFDGDAPLGKDQVWEWLGMESSIMATPHGQRSQAHIDLRVAPDTCTDFATIITTLIDRAEAALGTPVQTAVKRQDEQEFARLSGTNLMFAEDAARRVAAALEDLPDATDYRVEVHHLESLHPHDAIAMACSPGFASE